MVQQSESGGRSLRDASRSVRRSIARRAERWLGRFGLIEPRAEASAERRDPPEPPVASAPVEPPVAPAAPEVAPAGGMTLEAVQELFEDLVRPALQSDGGDITLLSVSDGVVRVRLMGACSTCPSSIVTMKQGIERLLVDEFPDFRDLVQVDG